MSHSGSDNSSFLFGTSPTLKSAYVNYSQKERRGSITMQPFIIGIAGGTAGGKTTVCEEIVKSLKNQRVAVISQDSFYKPLNEKQSKMAKDSNYNFDHPDAFDDELMIKTLKDLKDAKDVEIPIYDFVTHQRDKTQSTLISGADVIIIEGILVLYNRQLRDLMNMKIFVDTDADTRLARRIKRDIAQRGRDLNGVLAQYEKFVKPSFDEYILPTKKFADIIIPRGGDNIVAIDLLVKHIKFKLEEKDHYKGKKEKEKESNESDDNLIFKLNELN